MGKSDDLRSFQNNADGFICSLLPGLAHPQVQYSPGMYVVLLLGKPNRSILQVRQHLIRCISIS